ncbi:hypothetical protein HPB49_026172 [Dermacentor silvarum]|nr:hypothetical protein HPB49_026172 [Dermacentor silvarum]
MPAYATVPRASRYLILLVSSSSAPDRWIVPGGGLEPNEEPSTAAMREVMEEGGVRGRLGRCLGTFEVCLLYSLANLLANNCLATLMLLPILHTLYTSIYFQHNLMHCYSKANNIGMTLTPHELVFSARKL